MKNRVVGSQTRAIWSQRRAILSAGSQRRVICRSESQHRAWGCNSTFDLESLR